MKLYLYYVGKPRDAHANALAEEYIKRIRRYARLEMSEVKPERSEWWVKHASAWKVLLDPAGKSMDSTRFAGMVAKAEACISAAKAGIPTWLVNGNDPDALERVLSGEGCGTAVLPVWRGAAF